MRKNNKQQDNIPNLKTMAVVFFIMGLVTVYSIVPGNLMALLGYSVIIGGALLYYVLVYVPKQQGEEQVQDSTRTKLEALKAKMEADEAKLAETEKKIAQLEADQEQMQAELGVSADMTVKRWRELCSKIEELAFDTNQGRQYKSLLTLFSGKDIEASLSIDEAAKAKDLYQTIYTNGLATMKKRYHGEKSARADIKANIEKDIRRTKKKRRK